MATVDDHAAPMGGFRESLITGPPAWIVVTLAFAAVHAGLIHRLPLTGDEALVLYRLDADPAPFFPSITDLWAYWGGRVLPGLPGRRFCFLIAATLAGVAVMRITWLSFRAPLATVLAGIWFHLILIAGRTGVTASDGSVALFMSALAVWSLSEVAARRATPDNTHAALSVGWIVMAGAVSLGGFSSPVILAIPIGLMISVPLTAHLRQRSLGSIAWIALILPAALHVSLYLTLPYPVWPGLPDQDTLAKNGTLALISLTPGIALLMGFAFAAVAVQAILGARRPIPLLMVALTLTIAALGNGFTRMGVTAALPALIPLAAGVAVTVLIPRPVLLARMATPLALITAVLSVAVILAPSGHLARRIPALLPDAGWPGFARALEAEANKVGAGWVAGFDPELIARLAFYAPELQATTLRADLPRRAVDCGHLGLFLASPVALGALQTQFDGATPLSQISRRIGTADIATLSIFAVGRPVDYSMCQPGTRSTRPG